MLHTVNKSPFEKTTLQSCLASALPGSAILLIEDGVYAAQAGTAVSATVEQAMQDNKSVYALGPDLEARGLADKVMDGIKVVDYAGFVDLAVDNGPVEAWL
jgi:tRNA 2-thiouridine synthesizing protein B